MKKLWLYTILVIICPLLSFAQTPDTLWTRIYGGVEVDKGYSVQQTTDGGYIIVGETASFGAGGSDVWLLKTDENGDTLWTTLYGGMREEVGYSVQQTTDSGYIITGFADTGPTSTAILLLKTTTSGQIQWSRYYELGQENNSGYSVQQTTDNGYIIAGHTGEYILLLKTDENGDPLWTKTYMEGGGRSVDQTVDNGYIIAGGYSHDCVLIKTNANGDTIWTKTYWSGVIHSVQETSDGGYIIVGREYDQGECPGFITKTDSAGEPVWGHTFYRGSEFFSVQETSDGGYIFTGEWNVIQVIKVDANGEVLWDKSIGGVGRSVQQTIDGGYIIAGFTSEIDVHLVKLGPDVGVEEQPFVRPIEKILTTTIFCGPLHLPEGKSYKVFDITGRQTHTLNPSPGIYFIQVDGKITQKVVKVR